MKKRRREREKKKIQVSSWTSCSHGTVENFSTERELFETNCMSYTDWPSWKYFWANLKWMKKWITINIYGAYKIPCKIRPVYGYQWTEVTDCQCSKSTDGSTIECNHSPQVQWLTCWLSHCVQLFALNRYQYSLLLAQECKCSAFTNIARWVALIWDKWAQRQ